MVVISIETIGHERFIRGFNRYVQKIKDFRKVFRMIAEDFWDMEQEIFDAEGKPEVFPPLSKNYKRWKDTHYPGRKIMQLKYRLIKSLTAKDQGKSQDSVLDVRKKSMEIGTRVPYAIKHQMGHGDLPVRKIVQLTEPRKVKWSKMIHEWAYRELYESVGGYRA